MVGGDLYDYLLIDRDRRLFCCDRRRLG